MAQNSCVSVRVRTALPGRVCPCVCGWAQVYNVSVAACDGRVEQHWAVGTHRDGIASLSFATEVAVGLV